MPDIKGLVEKMLLNLLLTLIGSFSEAVKSFILHLREELANNPSLEEIADTIIDRVSEEHPDWSWEKKMAYASQTGIDYLEEIGKDVARAFWNAVVEVKIVDKRIKAGALPTPSERMIGSTQGGTA